MLINMIDINVVQHVKSVKPCLGKTPMKVTRAQADLNRERILDSAAQLFREKGFDGIGLNDLMHAAGLTRGGFYGHFESKEDLAVQASRRALEANLANWKKYADAPGGFGRWVDAYLSDIHVDRVGGGCAFAALAADAARGGEALREAFGEGLEQLTAARAPLMPGATDDERRAHALVVVSTMVGALLLSRAVAQPGLSQELREAVKSAVLAQVAPR
jgi:TetR/AcrR family transcriptional repressor of nem operon